jgi:hypothetical protein
MMTESSKCCENKVVYVIEYNYIVQFWAALLGSAH